MILTDGASLTGRLSSLPSGILVTSDEVGTRLRTLNLEPVSSGIQALLSMGAWVPKFPSNWAYMSTGHCTWFFIFMLMIQSLFLCSSSKFEYSPRAVVAHAGYRFDLL